MKVFTIKNVILAKPGPLTNHLGSLLCLCAKSQAQPDHTVWKVSCYLHRACGNIFHEMIHHFIIMTYMLFIFRQWLIVFCVIATKCNTFYYNQKNRRCKKTSKKFCKKCQMDKKENPIKETFIFRHCELWNQGFAAEGLNSPYR